MTWRMCPKVTRSAGRGVSGVAILALPVDQLTRQLARTSARAGLSRFHPVTLLRTWAEAIGAKFFATIDQVGAATNLLIETIRWIWRSIVRPKVRIGRPNIIAQLVRVGVRSVFIVSLVSGCVGLILVLQMAPPLDDFGRKDLTANILGVAVLRELGPLIAAIVLTGFAGAAIAAEL
ncbi:MAG: ABC transporter permease, partial [Phycisphaerales bacterium]|nr:ABC transporter permease [Phycisphaerales bacterium]